jgi:hypothetical protein
VRVVVIEARAVAKYMVAAHLALGEANRVLALNLRVVGVNCQMLHAEAAHIASGVFQAIVPAAFHSGEWAAAQHADGFHHLVCDATPLHIQSVLGLYAQQAVHRRIIHYFAWGWGARHASPVAS